MSDQSKGLAGIVVADTSSSYVDGQQGILIYRGYAIQDLGAYASFEEVVYLLWYGDLPNAEQLAEFDARLKANRDIPADLLDLMRDYPKDAEPMAVLRTAVSSLGMYDPTADDVSLDAARAKALALTASMPTIVAAWERIRYGNEPIAPDPDLGHAANFLYMLDGEEPNPDAVAALNAYLVMLADHGFNASTFAARVTTGTGSDLYSAITSAVGTLKGPSHGGAAQRAMEQFVEAGEATSVADWYNNARATDRRIMGIGHRVYKVEDPRARILRPLAEKYASSGGESKWYDIAYEIEQLSRQDDFFIERKLFANVDYYSAVVLYSIGLPMDQFTCVFAISRVAGWTTHVLEQLADNRLIRPKANYVGEMDKPFVIIAERN
ncbi:MAG: citrate/2-methylcitrate synthase [Chloroflexota bacterium]